MAEEQEDISTKNKVSGFLKDMRSEVEKISWPTRRELVGSTWIVCAMILAMGLFVFLCDRVLNFLLTLVTNH